ncbi:Glutamate--cysteine ligase [Burkholderia glumae]|nr:Glutamate--cysteine ligase [Burkholderia glumae]QTP37068.1 Glutamate--cysteine ligase [Burkholderia glumae]
MTHDSPRQTWMTTPYRRRLCVLSDAAHLPLLGHGRCGVEREALRVDAAGRLALTQHPRALGAALTHPSITTDYAEPLLEFVTPPQHDAADVIERLDELHRFACQAIGDELLWSQSMPCPLDDDRRIPIAWYGTSNPGILKHVYRRGLALRYGKAMQCIAGIHYNYSLADSLWPLLREVRDGCAPADRDTRSTGYLALIRNFHRYGWLLLYLFGASPALCSGFVAGDRHGLEAFDAATLYLPYATSLRMSDLGYQNRVQEAVAPCLNDLDAYLEGLARAVAQPCPEYQAVGAKRDGEWLQLNTHLLQMENEFYSSICPKRTMRSGERLLDALRSGGIEYVEVRSLDIDPFAPHGVAEATLRFVDAFLLFCALDNSPCLAAGESDICRRNFAAVAREGRRPGLTLQCGEQRVALRSWARELLARIHEAACVLDQQRGHTLATAALDAQRAKLDDPQATPSARVLEELRSLRNEPRGACFAFGMRQSLAHTEAFRARPLPAQVQARFEAAAAESLRRQAELERTQIGNFDAFLAAYQAGTLNQEWGEPSHDALTRQPPHATDLTEDR